MYWGAEREGKGDEQITSMNGMNTGFSARMLHGITTNLM